MTFLEFEFFFSHLKGASARFGCCSNIFEKVKKGIEKKEVMTGMRLFLEAAHLCLFTVLVMTSFQYLSQIYVNFKALV